jgi:hypothetical protein
MYYTAYGIDMSEAMVTTIDSRVSHAERLRKVTSHGDLDFSGCEKYSRAADLV